jgi:hypothetical protein
VTEKKRSRTLVIPLDEVVAGMDLPNDEWTTYLDRRTGELVTVTDEDQRLVEMGEDPEDLPDWQRETLPKVREALRSDDFLPLPSKFDIHEYRIIERFSLRVEDDEVRDALIQAIRGRGAFRRFKEVLHERGLADVWYDYRQRAFEDIATEWLEANGIGYSRQSRSRRDEGV